MSEKDKRISSSIAEACNVLPEDKKEYLLGYAEGVAAMADKLKAASTQQAQDSA